MTDLDKHEPPAWDDGKVRTEAFVNRSALLSYSGGLYVLAFVMTVISWLCLQRPMGRAALATILLAFTAHTVFLVLRIYISGRPPVTNLYSSAVFIGWGGILFGLALESLFRMGIGNAVAAFCGFASAFIANGLESSGTDTMAVLVAVLDTQFWLATHVVLVTLGYTATLVSGFIGTLFILMGLCSRSLDKTARRNMYRMMYGTTCFAIFFSFIGTVLGGLWADDSWGRFWGWDPKENGALIIVLWNTLVLHARFGGMVKERGFAVLAVMGNVCTAWSWFGVNELGIGLHSYGFTEGALMKLMCYVGVQILIIGLGLIPLRAWSSYGSDST
jgi:ABC-type transport system involved in cytochrome c biogenesis permease subunit